MIENDIILRIQELLDTGFYSQRAVARMVGVSNTTVSWVQRGKRKVYRDPTRYMVPRAEGPVTRCPSCGAKTQLPCFYCELKKLLKKHHLQYHSASIEKSSLCLDVALDGDEKKRYEEIRNWRMKQENPHFYNIPDDCPGVRNEHPKNPDGETMMKKYQNNELYYAEYEQVKDQIRDMDLLLFRRNCLISRVGRGFHYHAAKAVWWDDVLFSIEMRGRHGGRAIPLASQVRRYPGIIDVFRVNAYERWPEYKPEKGITFLKSLVGCHYGYFNFFKTAISHFPLLQLLNGFKKRNITVYDHENEKDGFPFSGTEYSCYCSEACAIADRISGVDPVPFLDNRYTEPADLARSSFYQYMFTIK